MSSPTHHTRPTTQSTFSAANKHPGKHTVQGLMADPTVQSNLSRTYLRPLAERPHRQKTLVRRQNVFEGKNVLCISLFIAVVLTVYHSIYTAMDAHTESPQMQLYLSDAAGAKPAAHSHVQAFQRTIPIQWCASGGSDTHRKVTISTELHNEISTKLRRSEHDLAQSRTDYHKEKIRTVVDTKNALAKVSCDKIAIMFLSFTLITSVVIPQVLGSGPTNISRFSLDLIRRQRTSHKELAPPVVEDVVPAGSEATQQQLLFYTDEEMERLLNEI